MIEIMRTLNAVDLSYAQALLKDAGIRTHVFDANISIVEGSLGLFPRRLAVINEDEAVARDILTQAGIDTWDGNPF